MLVSDSNIIYTSLLIRLYVRKPARVRWIEKIEKWRIYRKPQAKWGQKWVKFITTKRVLGDSHIDEIHNETTTQCVLYFLKKKSSSSAFLNSHVSSTADGLFSRLHGLFFQCSHCHLSLAFCLLTKKKPLISTKSSIK
jgi:hypothetical protein